MNLQRLRFVLGVLALLALVLLGVLVLFFGTGLVKDQIEILVIVVMALVGEVKASSAYAFDGTPKQGDAPDSQAGTSSPTT